jgi:hypothetical protein
LLVAVSAIALTAAFWPDLWQGGGLLGGDIYAYYLPQKAFYAECLRDGTLPFWNNRIGNGYPQLAESQTGVLYPLNLVLYRVLDLNTAYNASLLFHYWLAFVACWLLARRLGLTALASGLTALVYTYGWFPPRISLEWTIVGGAWLPLAMWCVESFVQLPRRKWIIVLAIVLALQLLAGHFLIAFLTQLLIVCYVPLRLWYARRDLPGATCENRRSTCLWLAGAVAGAHLLAAAQLVPTWELKRLSQRSDVNAEHDPNYGAVPPKYLAQVATPWIWYPEKEAFTSLHDPDRRGRINRVDAHLYFGMLPLVLMAAGTWRTWLEGKRSFMVWLGLGILAVLYMPGWFLPVTRHLPGFSFFEGPGRYGIIATVSAGLLAGVGFEAVQTRLKPLLRPIFAVVVLAITTLDLMWVSDRVHDADPERAPPVEHIANSPLHQTVVELPAGEPMRLFSEGHNVPSLVGAATYPVYLGLSPAAYYDPHLMLPQPYPFREIVPTPEQIDWLQRRGITHVLSVSPLDTDVWPIRLVWDRADRCLNPILGLGPTKAQVLYELRGTRGRAAWQEPATGPRPRIMHYSPQRVEIAAESEQGGTLVLTDLDYPGWQVDVDGRPTEGVVVDGMLRGVAVPPGNHVVNWTFHPRSFYWGAGISAAAIVGLVVLAWLPSHSSRSA